MDQDSRRADPRSQRIQQLVEECLSRQIAGDAISIEEIASSHADLMPDLGEALRKAALIADARRRARSAAPDGFAPPGYDIVRQIRRGGQGIVFEAVQRSTGRTVAIKWMRDGSFASAGDKMRFEREIRILAQLDHPHIVTIHDSGVTPAGDSYFVMNYIPGLPLDEYVEQASSGVAPPTDALTHDGTRTRSVTKPRETNAPTRRGGSGITDVRDGLRLFQQVCDAVHAAHLRGIIHRDLKPSNIRVDESGAPYVLDFGLAKLTEPAASSQAAPHTSSSAGPRLGGPEEFTQSGQFIGSLPWASPEQVCGRADGLDIRTDVYSLGVILYQLLTGCFPYPVLGPFRDVMDHITRTPPTPPRRLRPQLNDEIETIVLKCLAKEPARRYQSAGELARDIERYLDGEAIEAKRDSIHYVLRKQLRRYRVPLGLGAAFLLLLVAGLGASLYLWQRAVAESDRARNAELLQSRERAKAEQAREAESTQRRLADQRAAEARNEAAKSRAALDFIAEMFGAIDPVLAKGHNVTVAEVLDPAAARVARAFSDQPAAEAVVRGVLGQAYAHLGRYEDARRELQRAWELRQSQHLAEDAEALTLQHHLALALLETGDLQRSQELLQRVLGRRAELLGADHRNTLATRSALAVARQLSGDVAGAVDDTRRVLADQERVLGRTDRDTLDSMSSLADMLQGSGRLDEALAIAHDASERASAAYGAESNVALMCRSIEAEALLALDRPDAAASLLHDVIKGKEELYGERHPSTLLSLNLLATAMFRRHEDNQALKVRRSVVARASHSLSERDPSNLVYLNNLAQALRLTGHLDEAEPIFRRLIVLQREVNGPKARDTLAVMGNLGLLLMQRGKPDEALPLLEDALAGFRGTLPADHWMIGVAMMNLGRCQAALQKNAEAEKTLLDSHAFLEKTLGPSHERTTQVRNALAALYDACGRPGDAEQWRPRPVTSQPASRPAHAGASSGRSTPRIGAPGKP